VDVVSSGSNTSGTVDLKKGVVGEGAVNNGRMLTYNINKGVINKGEFNDVNAKKGIVNVGTVNNGPVTYEGARSNTNNGTIVQSRELNLRKYVINVEKMYADVFNRFVEHGIQTAN
jgi:hypothetical protein